MRNVATMLVLFAIGGALLVSGGCSGSSPSLEEKLVGTWKAEKDGQEMTFQFKEDKTMTMDTPFMPISGTWSVVRSEGSKLVINTALEMPSLKISNEKAEVKTKKIDEKEFSMVFETDDRIKMAPTDDPDDAATLQREKS